MNIKLIIAQELNIKESQVEATVKLIDEGNTIPFIARYRKEATGGLSDEILRSLSDSSTGSNLKASSNFVIIFICTPLPIGELIFGILLVLWYFGKKFYGF